MHYISIFSDIFRYNVIYIFLHLYICTFSEVSQNPYSAASFRFEALEDKCAKYQKESEGLEEQNQTLHQRIATLEAALRKSFRMKASAETAIWDRVPPDRENPSILNFWPPPTIHQN